MVLRRRASRARAPNRVGTDFSLFFFSGGGAVRNLGDFIKKISFKQALNEKKLLYGTSSNILTPKKAGKKAIIVVVLKNNIYL